MLKEKGFFKDAFVAGRKAASAVTVIRLPSQRDRNVSRGLRPHCSLPSPPHPHPPFTHPLIRRRDQWGNAKDGSAYSRRPGDHFSHICSAQNNRSRSKALSPFYSLSICFSLERAQGKKGEKYPHRPALLFFWKCWLSKNEATSLVTFLKIMLQRQEMQQNKAVRKWWLAFPAEPNQGQNW